MTDRFPTTNLAEFIGFIIIVFLIGLIMQGLAYVLFGGFQFFANFENGLLILMIGVLIIVCGIFILDYADSKKHSRPKTVDEELVDLLMSLDRNKKELLCNVYRLPNDDKLILEHIKREWNSDEQNNIVNGLKNINNTQNENVIYSNLISIAQKSLIKKVIIRDEYKCVECGKNILLNGSGLRISKNLVEDYHHIGFKKPLSEGGTITYFNMVCLCNKCARDNKKKR